MIKYILILFISLFFMSCGKREKENKILSTIKQWVDREIVYPESLVFTIQGVDTLYDELHSQYLYTLISYVDSTGCTSCKLQLPRWRALIAEMDSISNRKVRMCFIFHSKDTQDIIYTLKYNNFRSPVCIDVNDTFNKLNHLPSDIAFQTFLLNRDNKVVAIGNPVHNPKVKDLYMNIIQGKTSLKENSTTQTEIQIKEQTISFGHFNWKQEQKANFVICNVGKHPLVINDVSTSCGCTSVEYSKEPARPGDSISLQVTYKADKPEHFNKTITVYCNANPSIFHLKIVGDAE